MDEDIHDPRRILAENDGAIQSRRNRMTGTTVTVYRNDAQGLDDCDGTCPYSAVCEHHAGVVAVETIEAGRWAAAHPEGWCEECREVLDAARRDS